MKPHDPQFEGQTKTKLGNTEIRPRKTPSPRAHRRNALAAHQFPDAPDRRPSVRRADRQRNIRVKDPACAAGCWAMPAPSVEVNGGNLILIVCAYLVISLQHTHVWPPFTGRSPGLVVTRAPPDPPFGRSAALQQQITAACPPCSTGCSALHVYPRQSPAALGVDDLNHDPANQGPGSIWCRCVMLWPNWPRSNRPRHPTA